MIKCPGKRTLGFLVITADYPERGGQSIPNYLSLTPFLTCQDYAIFYGKWGSGGGFEKPGNHEKGDPLVGADFTTPWI